MNHSAQLNPYPSGRADQGADLQERTHGGVDEWLATGPTTRAAIRTFFVVAKKSRRCESNRVPALQLTGAVGEDGLDLRAT